jgi:hypothetical protein
LSQDRLKLKWRDQRPPRGAHSKHPDASDELQMSPHKCPTVEAAK